MIKTKGRLLEGFLVVFVQGEIRLSWVTLREGEQIAILIDRLNNKARLYSPLDECQRLASQHQYELVDSQAKDETFVRRIERVLELPLR